MAMRRKVVNKRFDGRFVQLFVFLLNSPAYLSLSCQARAVYIEISRLYDGSNNGRLGMSVRVLAKRCRIAPGTATKALAELQDRGFIECVKKGSFSHKGGPASEWRMTWWGCNVTGALPTKAFTNWGKENQKPVSNYSAMVSNEVHPPLSKAA
jgi:hypothetical protein